MSQHRTYVTRRGHTLLYVGEPVDCPVLTLENYTKWYELHLVYPDGTVTEVDVRDVELVSDQHMDAVWVDHLYHPRLLHRLARHLNADLDERALEVAVGRWMLEGPDDTLIAGQLNFTEPPEL